MTVPYCRKCGFQIDMEMQYCPDCGTSLKTQHTFQEETTSSARSNAMPVLIPSTPFTNGMLIGLGIAMLLGSLLGAFFLNADYWSLRDFFVASGLEPTNFMLSTTVNTIGACAMFAVIGIYGLVVGTLSQMNPSVRAVFNSGNVRVRLGSGLHGGALVFTAVSVESLVENYYLPDTFQLQSGIAFGIAGIIAILAGLLLIATARSR